MGKQTRGDTHERLCESTDAVTIRSVRTDCSISPVQWQHRGVRDASPPCPQCPEDSLQNQAVPPARATLPTAETSRAEANVLHTDTETPHESWTHWFTDHLFAALAVGIGELITPIIASDIAKR